MQEKLLSLSYRKKLIKEIKSDENIQRKIVSYKKMNMQNDNFHQYVEEYLESKLDAETVQEMHVFSNVNLQKRVSTAEAGVYRNRPERRFFVGDRQLDEMNDLYDIINVDEKCRHANVALKYQDQCQLQFYPENGKIAARVLLPHHVDVIPSEKNPELAEAYIISNFDNTSRDKIRKDHESKGFSQGEKYRDMLNQEIADWDDSQANADRFYFWSKMFNFVCNGKGEVLDKETEEPTPIQDYYNEDGSPLLEENILSPLFEYECLPFIDIASKKDFEFWVRSGDTLYDTTIMYNTILTSEFQTVELQGHAQAYYKGDAEQMPEHLRVGVDKLIFIPVNPNAEVSAEFGFANPGSDLAGIREFRESFLSSFLSSRGLDTSIVSGKGNVSSPTSGVEKMLQMIEKFEASQSDFALFEKVEKEMCKIVACMIKAYAGKQDEFGEFILGDEFQLRLPNEKIECSVEFKKPELVKTEMEELELFEKERESGLTSRVHYLMENKGMTEEQAVEHIEKVDMYEQGVSSLGSRETETFPGGSEPGI